MVGGTELEGSDNVIVDDDILEKDVLEKQVHGDMGTLLILQRSCFVPKHTKECWYNQSHLSHIENQHRYNHL